MRAASVCRIERMTEIIEVIVDFPFHVVKEVVRF